MTSDNPSLTELINKMIRAGSPSYKRFHHFSFMPAYGAAVRDGRKLLFWEREPLYKTKEEAIARAKEIQKCGFVCGFI